MITNERRGWHRRARPLQIKGQLAVLDVATVYRALLRCCSYLLAQIPFQFAETKNYSPLLKLHQSTDTILIAMVAADNRLLNSLNGFLEDELKLGISN